MASINSIDQALVGKVWDLFTKLNISAEAGQVTLLWCAALNCAKSQQQLRNSITVLKSFYDIAVRMQAAAQQDEIDTTAQH